MKEQFIKIQDKRYRLSALKMYEPFEQDDIFGIYVYFSMTGRSDRRYHRFNTKKIRDNVLSRLDELFNVRY